LLGALYEAEGKKKLPQMKYCISTEIRKNIVSDRKMQVLGDWRVSPYIICIPQYSV